MNNPLDDFNRRTTANGSSWMMGPPTNAAESAAQSFIDTQQRSSGQTGGGSIDFGARICAVLLLVGIALFMGGAYALDNMKEGAAIMGILVLIVSSFLMLIGGGGLAVACIKGLGEASGRWSLVFAVLAGLAAWWFSPSLWFIGVSMPQGLATLAAVALVFVFTGQRR